MLTAATRGLVYKAADGAVIERLPLTGNSSSNLNDVAPGEVENAGR